MIGYDDLRMSSWSMFDLTTVRQPLLEIATAGTHRLLDRIEGIFADAPERTVFPVHLVERGTTGPLARPRRVAPARSAAQVPTAAAGARPAASVTRRRNCCRSGLLRPVRRT